MKYIGLHILLLCALLVNAQDIKRTSIWYFGENAGVDFSTDPPTALTNGQVNTIEGCATMCDTNGNLLFYTDGRTVWNKHHDTIINGTGLFGDASSTQAALIVPYPDNDSLYYIFTTNRGDFFVNEGFYYTLISIKGNGEVVEKNKLLHVPVSEKLAATKHQNNRDYWVTVTEYNGNNLYTYLINNKGIVNCPILSSLPINFSSLTAVGEMKFSSTGKYAAVARYAAFNVDILAFDNYTGEFNLLFSINHPKTIYGVEFSSSEQYLYVTEINSSILQYSLKNLNEIDVKASKQVIYTIPAPYDIQAIQLALNNKIYISRVKSKHLWVINNPDTTYSAVNFDTAGLYLSGRNSSYGLPAMVSSFLYQPVLDYSYSLDCQTNHITLTPKSSLSGTYTWSISKSGGSAVFTTTNRTTSYTFIDTGWFDIELSVITTDTIKVKKKIHIKPAYKLELGNDTTLCTGQFLQLNAGNGQHCYLWQDSSNAPTYQVHKAGIYYVKVVSQNYCIYTDTINISYVNPPIKPVITQSNDTLYSTPANSYQWYHNGVFINGAETPYYKITQNGFYQVQITNAFGCNTVSDSFQVKGLGINKLPAQDYFLIYPIPTSNTLIIEDPNTIGILMLTLRDVAGRVFTIIPSNELELKEFSKGIYYLEITGRNNNYYTTKIIIN